MEERETGIPLLRYTPPGKVQEEAEVQAIIRRVERVFLVGAERVSWQWWGRMREPR